MKRFVFSLMIAAAAAGFSLSTAPAEEQGEIIYRAQGKNIFRSAETAVQRGRQSSYRAPIRAQYDANVYRSEGLATVREEHKTWVVSLHCDCTNLTRVYAGHALAD